MLFGHSHTLWTPLLRYSRTCLPPQSCWLHSCHTLVTLLSHTCHTLVTHLSPAPVVLATRPCTHTHTHTQSCWLRAHAGVLRWHGARWGVCVCVCVCVCGCRCRCVCVCMCICTCMCMWHGAWQGVLNHAPHMHNLVLARLMRRAMLAILPAAACICLCIRLSVCLLVYVLPVCSSACLSPLACLPLYLSVSLSRRSRAHTSAHP
jgi:hypothetical protein